MFLQKTSLVFQVFLLGFARLRCSDKKSQNLLPHGGERWWRAEMPYEAWFRPLLTFHFRKVVTCRFQRNKKKKTNITMEWQPRIWRGVFPIKNGCILQSCHVKQHFRGVPQRDLPTYLGLETPNPTGFFHVNLVVGILNKMWRFTSWWWRFSWCFIPTPTRNVFFVFPWVWI